MAFVAITLTASFGFEYFIIRSGGIDSLGIAGTVALMWIPGVVSILLRLVGREGFRDVGWRLGPFRYAALAFVVPLGCAALTYGASWLVGAVTFASAGLFMVCIVLSGAFVGWLRLAAGSVWVAVIMHAAHNASYQAVFDPWFDGELEPYLAGETGLFSILAYGLVVLWLWRQGQLRACVETPSLAKKRLTPAAPRRPCRHRRLASPRSPSSPSRRGHTRSELRPRSCPRSAGR